MRLASLASLVALSLFAGSLGCSADGEVVRARRGLPVALEDAEPGTERAPGQRERRRGKRFGQDVPVHVDGAFKGMLKFSELPPELPTRFQELEDGRLVRRFAWTEYFESIGVSVEDLRAVHFYGGRNIVCMVDGSEIRRVGDAFRFSFTRSDAGRPRLEPPVDGIRYNSFVDKIRAVAIYVDKTPPRYERGELHFADGRREPVMGERGLLNIPYSDGERHGGTRVYLDGAFVAAFRRRTLDSELLLDAADKTAYSLPRALAAFGVPLIEVKRARLVGSHDGLLGELSERDLHASDRLAFTVPRHSRGKIAVPSVASDEEERVHAILLFSKRQPADRSIPEGGSAGIQGSRENFNDSTKRFAARSMQ